MFHRPATTPSHRRAVLALATACLLAAAPACTTNETRKPKSYSGYSSSAKRSTGVRTAPRKDADYVSPMNRKPSAN